MHAVSTHQPQERSAVEEEQLGKQTVMSSPILAG